MQAPAALRIVKVIRAQDASFVSIADKARVAVALKAKMLEFFAINSGLVLSEVRQSKIKVPVLTKTVALANGNNVSLLYVERIVKGMMLAVSALERSVVFGICIFPF